METTENITTPSQAAKEKDCSQQTIYNALDKNALNGFRVGDSRIIIKDDKYRDFRVQEAGMRVNKKKREGK